MNRTEINITKFPTCMQFQSSVAAKILTKLTRVTSRKEFILQHKRNSAPIETYDKFPLTESVYADEYISRFQKALHAKTCRDICSALFITCLTDWRTPFNLLLGPYMLRFITGVSFYLHHFLSKGNYLYALSK